ncbi:NAD(P)H-dependent oxidoreductase [Clostridium lacusfryxellense]|nr:NAD(P)H-dependent oxidoreductase [Clostridium lacusfryxellense]MBU3112275.1 NAD(P)H-dependent oxidoreductase [Clostridium lacusfryxellense]
MKVLGIVGSKRKNGNTAYLVNETLKAIKDKGKDVETEMIRKNI